jgi:hypothetical protein
MLTIALTALFAFAGTFAVGAILSALHRALPQIAALRGALAAGDQRLQLRFRIVETVARFDDGKIVHLPVRVPAMPNQGLRAAA